MKKAALNGLLFLCFLLCYTPWQMNDDSTINANACEV